MSARASSADLYAAMPPPTPSETFIGSLHRLKPVLLFNRLSFGMGQRRIVVLHQPAPDLFHGSHGGLLGCRGKEAARAVLELPGALRRNDDESVRAGFRIVRDYALRRLLQIGLRHFRMSPESDGFAVPSGRAGCGWPSR